VDAVNLDGGGSTTMVVRGCWLNHTVSFPSDNEAPDHAGLRAVASGVYLR
jgi:exopolysaccharide biosynthesis protein